MNRNKRIPKMLLIKVGNRTVARELHIRLMKISGNAQFLTKNIGACWS